MTKTNKCLYVIACQIVKLFCQAAVNQADKIYKLYVLVYVVFINTENPIILTDLMQLGLSDTVANFLLMMLYVWLVLFSIPTWILMG